MSENLPQKISQIESFLLDLIRKGERILARPLRPGSDEFNKYSHVSVSQFNDSYGKWNDEVKLFLSMGFSTETLGLYNSITPNPNVFATDLVEGLRDTMRSKLNYLEKLQAMVKYSAIQSPVSTEQNVNKEMKSQKIFIVHGHDNELKVSVARFLEKVGLEPVILHEQVNKGKTIIEKFEAFCETVTYAIILLTADDLGCSKNKKDDQYPRARQNVIFEMGYFIGKLGRDNVSILKDDDVEKPGDIDGVVYISANNEHEWMLKVSQELTSAGYNIDLNKLIKS